MEHDIVTARYLSDNERYADLLNGYGFGGEQIISAEDLSELDSRTGLWQTVRRYGTEGERKSRLQPCVTLVLYYGKEWDGGKNLHELIDFTGMPRGLQKLVNDYPMHLLEIRKIEDTSVFKTDLKQVFDFIRYSEDEHKLRELVESDEAFRNMDEDAYDMAVSYTKATELVEKKKYHQIGGTVDMCKALTDMLNTERMEGGIQALIMDNLEEGKSAECIVEKLVKRFSLSEEQAKGYFEKYRELLKKL